MSKKTSIELVDAVAGIGEEIRQRAIEEARADIARHIEEMFVGGPKVDRAQFGGQSATDCILAALADMKLPPRLAEIAAQIEETDEVPAEFTVGVLFAARLMADPNFDY